MRMYTFLLGTIHRGRSPVHVLGGNQLVLFHIYEYVAPIAFTQSIQTASNILLDLHTTLVEKNVLCSAFASEFEYPYYPILVE